ncbi:MAG: hypothetical protein NTZ50_04400 [Chloroflexi bacterium]|nr:hypothetical protein [Chloroflexota bacterium]
MPQCSPHPNSHHMAEHGRHRDRGLFSAYFFITGLLTLVDGMLCSLSPEQSSRRVIFINNLLTIGALLLLRRSFFAEASSPSRTVTLLQEINSLLQTMVESLHNVIDFGHTSICLMTDDTPNPTTTLLTPSTDAGRSPIRSPASLTQRICKRPPPVRSSPR